jgi:hypothetical protein
VVDCGRKISSGLVGKAIADDRARRQNHEREMLDQRVADPKAALEVREGDLVVTIRIRTKSISELLLHHKVGI